MARDTIVALATPPGRGGVAVVRVSGEAAPQIAAQLLGGVLPAPRTAQFSHWHDAAGELIDFGLALYFPAPHSFTGEHVLELQGHGGILISASGRGSNSLACRMGFIWLLFLWIGTGSNPVGLRLVWKLERVGSNPVA